MYTFLLLFLLEKIDGVFEELNFQVCDEIEKVLYMNIVNSITVLFIYYTCIYMKGQMCGQWQKYYGSTFMSLSVLCLACLCNKIIFYM